MTGGGLRSVFSWNSFIALVVAGVESRLEFPGLTTSLPVRQVLEQGDDADPQVECDTGLKYKESLIKVCSTQLLASLELMGIYYIIYILLRT